MATSIGRELESLTTPLGMIFPATVVSWARNHPDSALYEAFEWDIEKAAYAHWLWQARRLIAIHVVSEDTGQRRTVALTPDRPTGGYRYISDVMSSAELRRQATTQAVRELERWRDSHQYLADDFRPIFRAIDRVAKVVFDQQDIRPPRRRGLPPPEERPTA